MKSSDPKIEHKFKIINSCILVFIFYYIKKQILKKKRFSFFCCILVLSYRFHLAYAVAKENEFLAQLFFCLKIRATETIHSDSFTIHIFVFGFVFARHPSKQLRHSNLQITPKKVYYATGDHVTCLLRCFSQASN